MKLVKDLQKWIDGYNEVKTLADELELAFDFYKIEGKAVFRYFPFTSMGLLTNK